MTQLTLSLGNKIDYEITAEIPTLSDLRDLWKNIPHLSYRNLICRENQYYLLHKELSLNSMYKFNSSERRNIFGDLRVGIRFPLVVMGIQITEATLLSHGIKRVFFSPSAAKKISFERLSTVWASEPEYAKFNKVFEEILDLRHCIHANRKTRKYNKLSNALGASYYSTLKSLDSLIGEMKKITS